MRVDIIPGAGFPDYELSDHTAKRRKLSELQAQHPMVLVLSRGGYCPKDRRQAEGLVQLYRELKLPIPGWSPSAPTISPKLVNTAPASAPTGLFSPTRGVSFKKIWRSPNTPILSTIP